MRTALLRVVLIFFYSFFGNPYHCTKNLDFFRFSAENLLTKEVFRIIIVVRSGRKLLKMVTKWEFSTFSTEFSTQKWRFQIFKGKGGFENGRFQRHLFPFT